MNLTDLERVQLLLATRSRTIRAADARRAKLILMLEDGESRDAIIERLGCDTRFISRWSSRFLAERLAGLYARLPGRAPMQPPEKLKSRVLNCTLKRKPSDGSTRSLRSFSVIADRGTHLRSDSSPPLITVVCAKSAPHWSTRKRIFPSSSSSSVPSCNAAKISGCGRITRLAEPGTTLPRSSRNCVWAVNCTGQNACDSSGL